jgi:thioredoxin 1
LNRYLLPSWQPGKQAIVYFTNDSCHECEKLQKPALNLLEATDTQIFTINASLDKTLASYYKILTVPTTIILDNYGEAQFMNHGYTNEKILSAQLEQV